MPDTFSGRTVNLYVFNELTRASIYGIGTYIYELTEALRHCHINVCIVNLKSDKPQVETEIKDGISYWSFPAPIPQRTIDLKKQQERYYQNVVYLFRLYIKDKKNLIFHLNYNHCGKLAKELKNAFVCKIIAVVHYPGWDFSIHNNLSRLLTASNTEYPDDFNKNLKKTIEEEMSLYLIVDHLICLSNFMYEILCRVYGLNSTKMTIIPNGLTDRKKNECDNKLLRKKWYVSSKEKIILFVGRMDKGKGLEFLFKAFRKILQTNSKYRLVIAGDGKFSEYTSESQDICTRIIYTGLLDKSQLYEWYRIADVGVIPSLFESFGYVAVEMMMHGLPIVATATTGLDEVIDDSCSLKVPIIEYSDKIEVDTDLLAEKISYLLQHLKEARLMSENSRKRFLKYYSLENFRNNMLEFYRSLFV